jgi:hypothetical protein
VLPKRYIARPKLPASGPKTPKPDPSRGEGPASAREDG